jgi:two-component system, cell cycle sensor histidine kinase and response regulator CckA
MLRAEGADEQLRAAVEAWGIGTFEWKHPGARVTGSKRFFELYGWSGVEELREDQVWSHIDARDRAMTRAAFERALRGDANGSIELVHRVAPPGAAATSTVTWVELRAQIRFERVGTEQRPCSVTGSVLDVTERKHVEKQLRRTEARFEEAVRSAQFGIFEHNHIEDPRAENCYWSPRLREIFGVGEAEPGSASLLISRIHVDDIDKLHAAVARAHDAGGDGYYDVEHRYHHPTLGLRWLLTRSSTQFGMVDGKRIPVRTVGAMLDVTARRTSEQEHEQRAEILNATIDFVAIMQADGALVYLNRAARQFLGLDLGADLGQHNLRAAQPLESLGKIWEEGIPAAARGGAWQGETEFLRCDGSVVPMSLVLLAHRGREGKPLLYSTIARDISRERQLEENMRQAQKMEAVGRLAGGIAHDFNNILSAILSFAYVAAGDIGEAGKGYAELQEIIVAGKRAAALTQQLLAFSRKQVLRPRIVDVGEVLTRMAPMLRRLVGEHIDFVLSLDPSTLRVKVDPTHLEQVLLNLAINARDAMENGGRLAIECRPAQVGEDHAACPVDIKPGCYVMISVTDSGVGMDTETREHVFEPFFTTKGAGRGTGLGLATVFGIVKQSGGAIYVESDIGRGSSFRAYFPSSNEPLTERRIPPKHEPGACGGVVLIAEDDPSVRQVVHTVLERAGYVVVGAAGPLEALALAREYPDRIDLLLTDVVMPLLSGKELAERMSTLRPNLRVIYMSGYTDKDIVHRGVLDENVHFLPKPITPARLLDLVARVLGKAADAKATSQGKAAAGASAS